MVEWRSYAGLTVWTHAVRRGGRAVEELAVGSLWVLPTASLSSAGADQVLVAGTVGPLSAALHILRVTRAKLVL